MKNQRDNPLSNCPFCGSNEVQVVLAFEYHSVSHTTQCPGLCGAVKCARCLSRGPEVWYNTDYYSESQIKNRLIDKWNERRS